MSNLEKFDISDIMKNGVTMVTPKIINKEISIVFEILEVCY